MINLLYPRLAEAWAEYKRSLPERERLIDAMLEASIGEVASSLERVCDWEKAAAERIADAWLEDPECPNSREHILLAAATLPSERSMKFFQGAADATRDPGHPNEKGS